MNRFSIFLIAAVCSPVFGAAQNGDGKVESELKRTDRQVFNTNPMPNSYRKDYAVAMPDAYRGDNCVPMPNVYQERRSRFTIKADSVGGSIPDSILLGELDKLKDTLLKKQQQEQRLKPDRP